MSMEANLWTAKKNSVEVLGHSLLSTLKSAVVVSPSGVIASVMLWRPASYLT